MIILFYQIHDLLGGGSIVTGRARPSNRNLDVRALIFQSLSDCEWGIY